MNGSLRQEQTQGWELIIYTPMSYEQEGSRRFPVVYVQDAGEVIDHTLNYLEHLFMTKRLPELIFVGIKPHNRNHDYTPWPAPAVAPGRADFGGGGADYLEELVHKIKPFIDGHFLTRPEREHTGILGCSLGGLISLYAYYLYPDVFGRIGLLSASFWYEGMMKYMRSQPAAKNGHRLYMYVGALEGLYKTNVQHEMVDRTKEAYAVLLEKGLSGANLKFEMDEVGTHDDVFFSQRLPGALAWLYGEEGSASEGECS